MSLPCGTLLFELLNKGLQEGFFKCVTRITVPIGALQQGLGLRVERFAQGWGPTLKASRGLTLNPLSPKPQNPKPLGPKTLNPKT